MRKTFAAFLAALLLLPTVAQAWGEKGHLMINRMAIDASAGQLPSFMREAADKLTYNGFEPDRWRDEADTPMNTAQTPDHFFDSEMWGPISTIEADRYAFMAKLAERKIDLSTIGYLPYAIMENYGRLRNAFRRWRNAKTPEDKESAQANAVVYAGILGHYVGDGSMPMHLSIHFNGWAEGTPNPQNLTMERDFHGRYENAYVNGAIDISVVRPRVRPPQRLDDVFGAVKNHLNQTFMELVPAYELEKTGEFKPESPKAKGTELIAGELARAATMLGNLWYIAWVESNEPVPQAARP